MINNKYLQKVNDVYFISSQIKEINPDLDLYFNISKNRYELHNRKENPSLCLTFFHYPDYRLIEKLIKTSKDNINSLIKEIDQNNQKLELNKESNLLSKAQDQLKEVFKYAEKQGNENLSLNQIRTILGNEEQLWQKTF